MRGRRAISVWTPGVSWVQVAQGRVRVNGQELGTGDGAAVSDERHLNIEGIEKGEILVFDLS